MVKLYYTPTSCGAASFIAAHAAGLHIEAEQVDFKTHTTTSGADFYKINPKGNVPTLVLDNGTVLNEGAATLQWIADQAPNTIAADYGTSDRYLIQTILNYTASEVHASYGPLFYGLEGDAKKTQLEKIGKKFDYISKHLLKDGQKQYLVGDKLSIADLYLYIVLSWSGYVGVDLSTHAHVKAFFEHISQLSVVKEGHAKIATNPAHV